MADSAEPMIADDRGQPDRATTLRLAELDWHPVDPGNPAGPQMAALWGDLATGPYGALLRVPAGFESPMHRHSSDEREPPTRCCGSLD